MSECGGPELCNQCAEFERLRKLEEAKNEPTDLH
jgi:hypothetical protein